MNKPTVYILATVRKVSLIDAATFSFRSIRAGFPTSTIKVCGNGLNFERSAAISNVVKSVGGLYNNIPTTAHDAWIQYLIYHINEPFWIADTDLLFLDKVEDWDFNGASIAGRYEPTFHEEWTGTIKTERLHTCLMYIDPLKVRNHMRKFMCTIPEPLRDHVEFALIRQTMVPQLNKKTLFYDTMAGYFHSNPTRFAFGEKENKAFEHLHCATYVDAISKSLTDCNLIEAHKAIYKNPANAIGMQQFQNEYYNKRAVV